MQKYSYGRNPLTYLAEKHKMPTIYLFIPSCFQMSLFGANWYPPTSNTEREAMDNQVSDHNAEPASAHRYVKVFFYFAFIASVLTAIVNPAYALPIKGAAHTTPSHQFIRAKAAIVIDPNGLVIYAKNQDVRLPPASTTKLLTAMVALDRVAPELKVKINRSAIKPHSAPPRLRVNEELTVSDLLHLALMKSVNSAAVALAEEAAGSEKEFVELMNQKALAIGAVNSKFANASGLPEGVQYTTVYDLTVILSEALKYPMIKEILGKKEYLVLTGGGRSIRIRNTVKLLWATDNMIGGKTGYTRNAQHCFVGAFQTDDGPLFTAVLGTRSRNRMWKSTEMLHGIGTGLQAIPSIKLVNAYDSGASIVSGSEGKNSTVKHKKSHRVRHTSKKKHKKPAIRLVRKY